MELEERAQEALETLWILTEENKKPSVTLADLGEGEAIDSLLNAGYVEVTGDNVTLTAKGRPEAINVIRRHRLAERLLVDVLGDKEVFMHERACKFEHLLDHGLDESICSLLGHPKICPHGKPIPPGRCCQAGRKETQSLVLPLSRLTRGQKGKVAYIYSSESSRLQKLMAMGILPGAPASLVQSLPSYVFQIGETQFAVDKEIADAIYIRLMNDSRETTEDEPKQDEERGRGKFGRRFRKWMRRKQAV